MSSSDDILGGASTDGEPIGFKRHLVLPSLVLTAVELLVIVVPLVSLFGGLVEERATVLRIAIPVAVSAQLLWVAVSWKWLRPLYHAVLRKRQSKRLSDEMAMAAYRSTFKTPLRALALRTGLWTLSLVGLGFFFTRFSDWDVQKVVQFVALGTFHAFVASLGRAVWLQYLMRRFRTRLFSGVGKLRLFADGYFRSLMLVSMVCVGLTLAAIAAFALFFMPLSMAKYLSMQLYFPMALAVGIVAIYVHGRQARRIIDRYLESQLGDASLTSDQSPSKVYRSAQALPYRMAISYWLMWLVTAVLAVVAARTRWEFESDDAFLLLATIAVIAIGSALYQALWHREIMRYLLDHLTVKHKLAIRSIRTNLTLRAKLLMSFGGMVFFAVGLALLWGFVQYKNLVTKFTASQTDLGLAWVRSEVQGAVAASDEAPSPVVVHRVLDNIAKAGNETSPIIFYLPTRGRGEVRAYGGGLMGTPTLPWYAIGQMELEEDARISLRAHSLVGRRGRLRVTWRQGTFDLGSVAVFYPNYKGRGPSIVRPVRELLVFFLVLFGVCSGIVVLTVAQFVKPIRKLEGRADGMARGELAEPVSSGGEGDEIGRLTFALEEMRRALREKLRSTEEVNLDLERAVQRRTADLAKKNRELAETLEKLTRAQDQLVRSEKMASIGQLVAGIAHEINNPVNAIVNTVGPLGEAIVELDSPDTTVRAEAAEDVKDMIRVVQRGAQRTKVIVQALHNYSRTDDESVVEVDLNRSLDDSLELLRHVLKQNFEVERDYSEVPRVVGHAGQLNQVFMNLLTNAAQACAGQDDATLKVATAPLGDDRVVVSITDNGAGMSPEVMGRIFDPFFTTKDVGEGSGLGLSIVHGIVERHGGTIEVDSEVGQGTTFRVILPKGEGVPISHGSPGETLV